MNIFWREMKAYRKSLIIWCIFVLYMVAAGMWKFASAYSANQSLNELINQLPGAVRVLLGIRGSFDLSTAGGYYGLLYYYLVTMATVHATLMGAGIISKEELDKTTEFLMTKPISRNQIVTAKLGVAFVNILIFNMVATISSIFVVGYFNTGEALTGEILTLMMGMFLLQLIFMLVGTGIAAVNKNPNIATPLALITLMIALVLAKAIDMSTKLEAWKYFTPIKYFEAEQLLLHGGFEAVFLILSVVIMAIFVSATYIFYKRKDLRAY